MTPFEIWWVVYPLGVLYAWWLYGKLAHKIPGISLPMARGLGSVVAGGLWPLMLLEVILSLVTFFHKVAQSMWKHCVTGDMSVREWWNSSVFDVEFGE